jgi:hypothetical protein
MIDATDSMTVRAVRGRWTRGAELHSRRERMQERKAKLLLTLIFQQIGRQAWQEL